MKRFVQWQELITDQFEALTEARGLSPEEREFVARALTRRDEHFFRETMRADRMADLISWRPDADLIVTDLVAKRFSENRNEDRAAYLEGIADQPRRDLLAEIFDELIRIHAERLALHTLKELGRYRN